MTGERISQFSNLDFNQKLWNPSTKVLKEMVIKFEQSGNLINWDNLPSILIFFPHLRNLPKNLPCCEGTFVMFNVFLIRRPSRQYILCIG